MKIRDSGMPAEHIWQSFFEPETILAELGLDENVQNLVDFGCGYGTFAIAAAKLCTANIYALDIDESVLKVAEKNALQQGLNNIHFVKQDFIREGAGFHLQSIDFAMMFNILHMENPELLLAKTLRMLRPGGKLAIMHWNDDAQTPRGPAMSIRPKPRQIIAWARSAGFAVDDTSIINLPPYHYGLVLKRPLLDAKPSVEFAKCDLGIYPSHLRHFNQAVY
jgi:2-polyprenyl-3-methyl-5-hydroxy-6-metoxy-1,4-benzoquinol methylase